MLGKALLGLAVPMAIRLATHVASKPRNAPAAPPPPPPPAALHTVEHGNCTCQCRGASPANFDDGVAARHDDAMKRKRGGRLGYGEEDPESYILDKDSTDWPSAWERTATMVERTRAPKCRESYDKAVGLLVDYRQAKSFCQVKLIERAIERAFVGPCKSARSAVKKAAASCRGAGGGADPGIMRAFRRHDQQQQKRR